MVGVAGAEMGWEAEGWQEEASLERRAALCGFDT